MLRMDSLNLTELALKKCHSVHMDHVLFDYVVLAGNASITLHGLCDEMPSTVIYGVHGRSNQPKNRWECASLHHCKSVSPMGLLGNKYLRSP